jgi:glycosyltransferase involved in cell wall biosynthesis
MFITLSDLPPAPPGRTGFPWTEDTPTHLPDLPDGREWPRITVVTPSYNQGEYLEETVRSILLQGYPNLEYMVIDGGSDDGSVEIIQKYGDYLAYWVSEPDQGQSDAINKGFRRSTGTIMGWINSDDVLLPGALQRTAKAFVQAGSVSVTTGFRKVIDRHSNVVVNWFRGVPDDRFVQHYDCIAQETTFWRREVWEKIGELDISLFYGLDYEYYIRMVVNGYHFTLLPYYIGCFRHHPDSKGAKYRQIQKENLKVIFQRYGIASSEEDALAQLDEALGRLWRVKLELIKDLNHHRLSDNPATLLFIFRLLHVPLISHLLLGVYQLYKGRGR